MMIEYILLIFAIALVGFVSCGMSKSKRNCFVLFLSISFIVLLQALRAHKVGMDLAYYIPAYTNAKNYNFLWGDKLYNWEIGYCLFMKGIRILGFSEQQFLAIISFLVHILIAAVWYKKSDLPALSVLIYVCMGMYTFTFSGLRQSIALALTFFSYLYIEEKKLGLFLACILLAMSFHITAIVFLPAYFASNYVLSKKQYYIVFPLLIAIFVLRKQLYSFVFLLYKGRSVEIVDTGAYELLLFMVLIYIASFVVHKIRGYEFKHDKHIKRMNSYRNLLLCAIVLQFFATCSDVAGRLGYYYFMFLSLIIPEMLSGFEKQFKWFCQCVFIMFLIFFFWWTTLRTGYLGVAPYVFFWE